MSTQSNKTLIWLILCCSVGTTKAFSYEIPTHELLNRRAALQSEVLDGYLTKRLGLPRGVETTLLSKTIIDIVAEAGAREDDGWRFMNHFHNPLRHWHEAGLHDTVAGVPVRGESSLLWAQNPPGAQGWSWHDGRASFYQALTAEIKTERDQALANTFRAVGQVMHLIEDASVPAHVRSDAHPPVISGYHYETWADKHKRELDTTLLRPNLNLTSVDPDEDLVPIYRLFDTDQYTGDNPDVTDSLSVGIAEYTNAHFFSDDTMFADAFDANDRHYFPHPSKASVDPIPWVDPLDDQQYLAEVRNGGIRHVVLVSWLYRYRLVYFPEITKFLPVTIKDDLVFEEQAQHLVPRAVGYASAALDYFFRGQIDLSSDPVTYGQFVIQNKSGEPMNGTFALYYDDIEGDRHLVASWDRSIEPGHASSSVSFTPPTSPTPKDRDTYILVFRGTMGGESGAVAASVVVASVSPPLYARIWTYGRGIVYWDIEHDREVLLGAYNDVSFNGLPDVGSFVTGDIRFGYPSYSGPGETPTEAIRDPGSDKIYLRGVTEPFGTRQYSVSGSLIWQPTPFFYSESYTVSDMWSDYLMQGLSWSRGNARVQLGIDLSRNIMFSYSTTRGRNASWTYDYKFGVYLITDGIITQTIEEPILSTTDTRPGFDYFNFYYNFAPGLGWPLGNLAATGRHISLVWRAVTQPTFHPNRDWSLTVYYDLGGSDNPLVPSVINAVYIRVDYFDYDGTSFRHLGSKELPRLQELARVNGVATNVRLVTGKPVTP